MDNQLPTTRACVICKRKDRRDIERAMASSHPLAVAAEFLVDERTVKRHLAHLTERAAVVLHGETVSHAKMVVQTLHDCMEDAHRIQQEAERLADLKVALMAIRERTRIGEVFAKLTLAATLTKQAPMGPGAPPWDKLSTPERIAKCDETIAYFAAWKQRLVAQEVLASGGQFAAGIVMDGDAQELAADDEVLDVGGDEETGP